MVLAHVMVLNPFLSPLRGAHSLSAEGTKDKLSRPEGYKAGPEGHQLEVKASRQKIGPQFNIQFSWKYSWIGV